MRIYLVRHGEACSPDKDPRRPLTSQGRKQIRKTAEILLAANATPDEIWHSEKLRAKETAGIIANTLNFATPLKQDARLNPNGPFEDVILEIEAQRKDIVLAGHLPFMSLAATHLLAGAAKERVTFFPGTVACFRLEYDEWQLDWLIPPELA